MLGTEVNPGIIPRTVNGIFHSIRSTRWNKPDGEQWEFRISFSYLEIYQEKVNILKNISRLNYLLVEGMKLDRAGY